MNKVFVVLLFIVYPLTLFCQASDSTVFRIIENMYRKEMEAKKIPGLAFGIVVDGKLMYSRGMGFRDTEKKSPVTPTSVYRIASMTKSFCGLAILKLRDEGKLNLDDPVSRFIPEIKNTPPLTSDSPPITIRNLLTHTAGFPEDNPWGDRQLQRTDEELIRFIEKGISLSSVPGISYEYSNLGFTMLGNIVSKASGMHYEKYIREKIFLPLGMHRTFWEYSDVAPSDLVYGYRVVNESWKKEEMLHSGAYGAMGGMLTSVDDFAKYMSMHISAWPPGEEDAAVVRKSTLREMHLPGKIVFMYNMQRKVNGMSCPRIGSYNAGLAYSKDCQGMETVGHSGGLPGFGSHWVIAPQYRIGVVSFCNLTYAATSSLNFRIVDTLITLLQLKPKAVPVSPILRERKDQLAKLLPDWNNAEASNIFSENFFLDYFIDSLKKDARKLFAKAGKIISTGEMVPENNLRGYFIIHGRDADLKVYFTLSPENPPLIQEYDISEMIRTKER